MLLLSSSPNNHRFTHPTDAVLPSADRPKYTRAHTHTYVSYALYRKQTKCVVFFLREEKPPKKLKVHLRSLHKAAYLECLNKVAIGSEKILHLIAPNSPVLQEWINFFELRWKRLSKWNHILKMQESWRSVWMVLAKRRCVCMFSHVFKHLSE